MNILKLPVLLGIFTLFSVAGLASPCGKSGMTVVRAYSGKEFVLYVFREGPDIAFQLQGKEISFPNGFTGPKTFNIAGIHFESLFVKVGDFMKSKDASDLEILKKHREYEFEYIQKTPSPLKQLIELGPRERPAGNKQPAFTFYLWKASNPLDPKGTSQFFLTTVSGGEVAVLSAIVPDQSNEPAVMQAFQSYVSSFQHILQKEQCPEDKRK